jgi:hypothetical protein
MHHFHNGAVPLLVFGALLILVLLIKSAQS